MAIAMTGLLPLMFFSLTLVEASRVYGVKNQLQATADAAAMASVWELEVVPVSETAVQDRASAFANYNMPADGQYGDVLSNPVEIGNWDPARPTEDRFDPAGAPENAVRVTTSGEMPLFFAGALRSLGVGAPDSFTPSALAIALLRLDKCYTNGFVAGGIVEMNSSNSFDSGFCVYGRQGVTVNSANTFAPGTEVGMLDLATLDATLDHNDGLEEALVEKIISAPVEGEAEQLLIELLDGTERNIPSWPPDQIELGTLYYVEGAVDIDINPNDPPLEGIKIISGTSITVQSGSKLRDITLGSFGPVNIDSNVRFGDENFCQYGEGSSLIISATGVTGEQVETGSRVELYGVQMVVEGDIVMNSNLKITAASVQSTGNISFNSQFQVAGCPDGTHANATGDGTKVSQLVD